VWGVDLVEEHLMVSVGIPARPPVAKRPLVQMAEYSINAKKTGVIRDFDFLNKWQDHADVLYARPLVPVSLAPPLLAVARFIIQHPSSVSVRGLPTLPLPPTPPPKTQAGSKVVCVEDGLPTWVCELMVVKPTVDEAIEFIKSIEEGMDIVIDPLPAKK
jgi:hypothetical protein